MARFGTHTSQHDSDDAHGNRPWVFFMIDCFFLVTQFFVITFQVRIEESVLPQQLPPGKVGTPNHTLATAEPVRVHIVRSNGKVAYNFLSMSVSLEQFEASLRRVKEAGRDCIVRVSYAQDVHFSDVMAVFNTCSKLAIEKCGLVPLREGSEI
jgi:biopolymer transport protein ExbD